MNQSLTIAIVGCPNVGKSSLLNRLLGEDVAIVSPKPQTTRTRIMGVRTEGERQLIFIDTPGWHKPKTVLGQHMQRAAEGGMAGTDAVLFVTDAERPDTLRPGEIDIFQSLKSAGLPVILIINKVDLLPEKAQLMKRLLFLSRQMDFFAVVPLSAKTGDNFPALEEELENLFAAPNTNPMPHFLFPEDELTDQPEKVLAAEFIREQLLRQLDQEIPHGTAVAVEHMTERTDGSGILDVDALIYCERETHKGIIIGKGGERLKEISTQARRRMERFFDCKVFLRTRVKVKEDWRNREVLIRGFGLDTMKE
ncbi:MAG: GTPase Era [Oscillospiraceae bacterium]|jgi:GTP-binding protein Era|nr:GTPase Era [Oscillospiraceae bacterium]